LQDQTLYFTFVFLRFPQLCFYTESVTPNTTVHRVSYVTARTMS